MAQSLETLRSSLLTSIFGRRLGLTPDDYLAGPKAMKTAIEDLTTAGGTVLAYGLSRITATGSSQGPVQYALPAPVPGVEKELVLPTTSTGSFQFLSTAAGADIHCASDGTTKGVINLVGPGGSVRLKGLTSTSWAVIGAPNFSSTALAQQVTYTTST